MGPTQKLVTEFARRGHVLASGIMPREIPALIDSLRQRLGVSEDDLDLSPNSLKRLEKHIVEFHQTMQKCGGDLRDEDLLSLVRETAAYVGETLVRNTTAIWKPPAKTLWATEIEVEGPWDVTEDERYISPYPTIYALGAIAAWAWDSVVKGKKPRLYRVFHESRTKKLRNPE